jgi:putative ABC transport system substrate-binding protein
LGWSVGRNLEIDYRYHLGDAERTRKHPAELVALAPDVILATGTIALGPLMQTSRACRLCS